MAEQMPEQAAMAAEQGGGEGGGGEFKKLAGNVLKGMALIGQGLEGAGAPPEALEGLMQIMQQFEGLVESLAGGGAPQEQAPQKSKAVPIQESQGRPVGPAGV